MPTPMIGPMRVATTIIKNDFAAITPNPAENRTLPQLKPPIIINRRSVSMPTFSTGSINGPDRNLGCGPASYVTMILHALKIFDSGRGKFICGQMCLHSGACG